MRLGVWRRRCVIRAVPLPPVGFRSLAARRSNYCLRRSSEQFERPRVTEGRRQVGLLMKIATWTLIGGFVLTACASAPKPAPVRPPVRAETDPEQERRPYAEEAPNLPQTPAEVDGLWIHLQSPSSSWSRLPTLVQGFPALAPFKQLAQGGGLLPRDAAAVIDLSQPLDVSMPMPSPGTTDLTQVWIFRVRSPEAVLHGEAGLTLHRVSPGVWDMGSVSARAPEASEPPLDDDEEGNPEEAELALAPLHCRLAHLPEPIGFRVLCAKDVEHLALAQPLLRASLAIQTSSDLHLELAGASYRAARDKLLTMTQRRASMGDQGDRRVTELLTSGFAALLEHQRLTFDFSLDGPRANAGLAFVYEQQSQSPRFEKWLAYSAQGSLPPSFARLSSHSGMTIGAHGFGSELVSFLLEEMMAVMDETTFIKPKDAAEARAIMKELVPTGGRITVGFGYDTEAALSVLNAGIKLTDEREDPPNAADAKALQAAMAGWVVIGIDAPPSSYLPALKRLYASRNMPAPSKDPKADRRYPSHTRWRALPVPAGMPAGTQHYLAETRKNPKYQDGYTALELEYDENILAVPDTDRVWIVIARSKDGAVRRARALLADKPAELPKPAPEHPAGAFFFDMASMVQAGLDWDSRLQRETARHELGAVLRAPKRGKVQTPIWFDVVPHAGGGYSLRAQTQVNLEEWLVDLVAVTAAAD